MATMHSGIAPARLVRFPQLRESSIWVAHLFLSTVHGRKKKSRNDETFDCTKSKTQFCHFLLAAWDCRRQRAFAEKKIPFLSTNH